MLISLEHRAVFLHNPKTGGTSFRKVLRGEYGFQPLHELVPQPRNDHSRKIPQRFWDFFIFTCCRNPYDRMVSGYTFQIQREKLQPLPFRTYVESKFPYGPQINFVALSDLVIRFEELSQPIVLPFGTFTLPHLNQTKRKPWQNYITPQIEGIIFNRFRDDFLVLKYPRLMPDIPQRKHSTMFSAPAPSFQGLET